MQALRSVELACRRAARQERLRMRRGFWVLNACAGSGVYLGLAIAAYELRSELLEMLFGNPNVCRAGGVSEQFALALPGIGLALFARWAYELLEMWAERLETQMQWATHELLSVLATGPRCAA